MKSTLTQCRKSFCGAFPDIALALFLFASIKYMNASDNIILAIIMPYYFRSIRNKKINLRNFGKDAILFTLLGILSNIAATDMLTMLILNLLIPFCVVFFLSDDRSPNKYLLYGLVYIIFQMYCVPTDRLVRRVIVFTFAFVVVFIAACITYVMANGKNGGILDWNTQKIEPKFSKESTQFRYALRLSVTMFLSSIIVCLLDPHIPKAYWFLLNAYLMMLPFCEDTVTRISLRIKGTILGTILFFVTACVMGIQLPSTVVVVVSITGMYMVKNYALRTCITTLLALFLSARSINGYELVFLRVTMIASAAVLVYLGNRFILPARKPQRVVQK